MGPILINPLVQSEFAALTKATGVFPQGNGITANKECRAGIDPHGQFGAELLAAVRRGDALTSGKYLKVPHDRGTGPAGWWAHGNRRGKAGCIAARSVCCV